MHMLSEEEVAQFLDYPVAIEALENVFISSAQGETENFPLVRSTLRGNRSLVGVKSGCNYKDRQLGLKAGGYWLDNAERKQDRHQSTVLLMELETGRPIAIVAGNNLTAIRTAAASAVAVRHLAREDSSVVGILGTGRQALFQIKAIALTRPIRTVSAWSPNAHHVAQFGSSIRGLGLAFLEGQSPEDAVRDADIVVTVTPSRQPLLRPADLKPGAHICAMGSDTAGKQELDVELLQWAQLFVDDVAQACSIGECQHLKGLAQRPALTALGDVIVGRAPGRRSREAITVFDGTGLAVQDLAVAHAALERAHAAGSVRSVHI